uniref:Uncharacterized protein n=1 Tax=Rhizophora mucronata TaxID=61149 RepID=A0A2P2MHJ4_RHIMU
MCVYIERERETFDTQTQCSTYVLHVHYRDRTLII